jgi:hypothetical protein
MKNTMTKVPKMTRAHFQYLAGLMAEMQPTARGPEWFQWANTVDGMAIALTWTNDNFNKAAFKAACGKV